MTNLARTMFTLEMLMNQGKKGKALLLDNQPEEIQREWQKDADAVERFLGHNPH